jgi:AcrR family transcriptional regulator
VNIFQESAALSNSSSKQSEGAPKARAGRQEIRTRETRELLLKAAEAIFIRDGYEGADLGAIAELADRSKGAIYGHFKSKEDIFLALVADRRQRFSRELSKLWTEDPRKNISVMRQFMLDLTKEEGWAMLQLEFKLFTLRHPGTKKRFQLLYDVSAERKKALEKLLGPSNKGTHSVGRFVALHSIGAILSSLVLEAEFEPGLITRPAIKAMMSSIFDCLLGA